MGTYIVNEDIAAFGFQVNTFPDGIGEAFDKLIAMVPEGLNRSYYGLSYMTPDNKVVYIAAVEEKMRGEAESNNCEKYKIEKGKYLTVTVLDWQQKTHTIKDVFHNMMSQKNVDHGKPCVEWYKNDDEMMCMLKLIS
ncbi:MAG TPA: transcriptional regulator [Chryseolinea sp.]